MSGRRTATAGDGRQNPLVAAAQIMLGVTLSCLISALCFGALIGAIVLVVYLLK